MKIISLEAENIKRLVAIEINPTGSLVQITGKNGSGKTSALDAIWWAIEGARHIQTKPIRKGADKARIRLDLGELIVTRRFNRQDDDTFTTSIVVENAEGARFPSPQAVLDKLVGALTFDPLHFTRLDSRSQVEALQALVTGYDFAAGETANDADMVARRDAKKVAANCRTRANAIVVPDGLPEAAIDEHALLQQLENAHKHNRELEAHVRGWAVFAQDTKDKRLAASRLRGEAEALLLRADEMDAVAEQQEQQLAAKGPTPAPIDTAEVLRSLETAKVTNASIQQAKEKRDLVEHAKAAEAEVLKLTKDMDARQTAAAAAIAAANLPVPGLTFADGEVQLNGLPFSQASKAEQLRASMAIAIAMSPKLKVIRVYDGSLVDDEGLQIIAEMAEKHGYQVWMERVTTGGPIGFVIENGELKSAPPEASKSFSEVYDDNARRRGQYDEAE